MTDAWQPRVHDPENRGPRPFSKNDEVALRSDLEKGGNYPVWIVDTCEPSVDGKTWFVLAYRKGGNMKVQTGFQAEKLRKIR
jgi:hypothetical protein